MIRRRKSKLVRCKYGMHYHYITSDLRKVCPDVKDRLKFEEKNKYKDDEYNPYYSEDEDDREIESDRYMR